MYSFLRLSLSITTVQGTPTPQPPRPHPELAPPGAGASDVDCITGGKRKMAGMLLIAPGLHVPVCVESKPRQLPNDRKPVSLLKPSLKYK